MNGSIDDFVNKAKQSYERHTWRDIHTVNDDYDVHLRAKTIRNRDVQTEYLLRKTNSLAPMYHILVNAELSAFGKMGKGVLEITCNLLNSSMGIHKTIPEGYEYNCVKHFIELMQTEIVGNAEELGIHSVEY